MERRPRPPDHRFFFPPDEESSPALAIAVPQFTRPDGPKECAPKELPHDQPAWQVNPNNGIRSLPHDRADLAPISTVDDPSFFVSDAGGPGAEFIARKRRPVRLPVDSVELDEGKIQSARQLSPERGLSRSRTPHHTDSIHGGKTYQAISAPQRRSIWR